MDRLRLPRALYRALLDHAQRSLPNECCGFLGGRGEEVRELLPATNALASPTAYEIPPRELFDLFRRLRAQELELVGIYHSHPMGGNTPSARDRERAFYPDAAYVILSPRPDTLQPIRAFRLGTAGERELPVEVVD